MKLITAIIRPEKLSDVKRALFNVGVTGMTQVGDGKIFVQSLDLVVRICTGERDDDALTAVNVDEVQRHTQMFEMPPAVGEGDR